LFLLKSGSKGNCDSLGIYLNIVLLVFSFPSKATSLAFTFLDIIGLSPFCSFTHFAQTKAADTAAIFLS
jgi:hypothetical protein